MRNTLLVFYSRTGTTKALAETIRARLNCDMEEVVDLKNRSGFFGNLMGGLDALFQRQTAISEPSNDPTNYDRIIVGSPVWYGNLAPAIRTWLTRNAPLAKKSAAGFFCTFAGKGNIRAGKKFSGLAMAKNPALLCVQNGEKHGITQDRVEAFAEDMERKYPG